MTMRLRKNLNFFGRIRLVHLMDQYQLDHDGADADWDWIEGQLEQQFPDWRRTFFMSDRNLAAYLRRRASAVDPESDPMPAQSRP
jgi:hypothetical protein